MACDGILSLLGSMESFSYTPRAGIYCLVFRRVDSLSDTPLAVIFLVVRGLGSFSYTPRAAICLVVKRIRNFSYTYRVGICLVVRRVGISLTLPGLVRLVSRLCQFLLHTV